MPFAVGNPRRQQYVAPACRGSALRFTRIGAPLMWFKPFDTSKGSERMARIASAERRSAGTLQDEAKKAGVPAEISPRSRRRTSRHAFVSSAQLASTARLAMVTRLTRAGAAWPPPRHESHYSCPTHIRQNRLVVSDVESLHITIVTKDNAMENGLQKISGDEGSLRMINRVLNDNAELIREAAEAARLERTQERSVSDNCYR